MLTDQKQKKRFLLAVIIAVLLSQMIAIPVRTFGYSVITVAGLQVSTFGCLLIAWPKSLATLNAWLGGKETQTHGGWTRGLGVIALALGVLIIESGRR